MTGEPDRPDTGPASASVGREGEEEGAVPGRGDAAPERSEDGPGHEEVASSSSRAVVGGRHLPVAIAVGVLLAGVFLATLFWHPVAFTVVVAVLTTLAYVEAHRVMSAVGLPLGVPVLVVGTLAMLFGAYQARHTGQTIGVLALFLGAIVWQLGDRQRRDVVRRLGVTLLFGLWVGFLASFAVLLVARSDAGAVGVLAVIGAAILTDIGGYGFGVAFGRHRITPTISPNKSWEGLIGGLAVATAAGAFVLPLVDARFSWQLGVMVALACGLASFVGDVTQSLIKRDLGLKDLGDLLPGHGGILDRVDSILVALPVGYFLLEVAF